MLLDEELLHNGFTKLTSNKELKHLISLDENVTSSGHEVRVRLDEGVHCRTVVVIFKYYYYLTLHIGSTDGLLQQLSLGIGWSVG